MNSTCYSSRVLFFLFLLLFQHAFASQSTETERTTALNSAAAAAPASNSPLYSSLALPLRAQKVSSLFIPRLPNELLFRHNISLIVALSVGSPPQNVSMVLDTGSELSWLLCNASSAAANATAPPPPFFDPRRSSSYSAVPCSSPTCTERARDLPIPPACDQAGPSPKFGGRCHVSLSYADGSTTDGALATDTFLVGSSPPLPTVFGCMATAYSSADGDPGAVGLLGMNRGALSFVTQTATPRFAYCIADRDSSGVLVLGDAVVPGGGAEARPNFALHLNYTPLIQMSLPLPYFDRVAYSVQLDAIRVGGGILPIPKSVLVPDHTGAGQTMVDSGTQFTFLLGPAYEALKTEFLRQTKGVLVPLGEADFVFEGAFDTCFRVPAAGRPPEEGLPEVALAFSGGAEVRVTGGGRLLYRAAGEVRGRDAVWCLTFGNSDLVPLSAYVIGHHHQRDVWVEYDLRNARVGFAPVRCDLAAQRLGLAI